jgi:hypothetical protein
MGGRKQKLVDGRRCAVPAQPAMQADRLPDFLNLESLPAINTKEKKNEYNPGPKIEGYLNRMHA